MTKSQHLKQIQWQDLRHLTVWQVMYNVILPYPFLLLSWWAVYQSHYLLALIGSYLFFAAAFRQVHDGYHHSLGTSNDVTTGLTWLLSALLFTSLHTIHATHLEHHRNPLANSDIEGSLAKKTALQALLGGIGYRLAIYRQGWQLSNAKNRVNALIDWGLIGLMILAVLGLDSIVLWYHLGAMLLANSLVGLIAVWGVHHGIDDDARRHGILARTERNKIINLLTFNLLFHVEHHLFPAVPSNHLPKLARRLDATLPHMTSKKVVTLSTSTTHNESCPIRRRFA